MKALKVPNSNRVCRVATGVRVTERLCHVPVVVYTGAVEVDVEGAVDVDGVVVRVVGVVELEVVVVVGPGAKSLTAGDWPNSAASIAGSFPSIPKAQIPIPRIWNELANWAFRAKDVGSSK